MIAFFNGYHIRQLRLKMGFGQAGFASLLGVLPGTLSRWETGDAVPAYGSIPALLILLLSHEVISLQNEKPLWWPKRKFNAPVKVTKAIASNPISLKTRKGNVRRQKRKTAHVLFSQNAMENARLLYVKLLEAYPGFERIIPVPEKAPDIAVKGPYFTGSPGYSVT